jgi:hypothetical protein
MAEPGLVRAETAPISEVVAQVEALAPARRLADPQLVAAAARAWSTTRSAPSCRT